MTRGVRALAAVLVAGCAARAHSVPLAPAVRALAAELDSAFAAPEYARATWGVVVQSLDNGQVLYRRNAQRLMMPASNQKILTGSVALARLGPEFRWRTTVVAAGAVRGDTLRGDLVVIGRGDPSLSLHVSGGDDVLAALRPWADSVRGRGIRVVTGRVRGDGSYFPDAVLGEGWMWDDLPDSYSAPVGALQFNEGFAEIEVTPGDTVGAPARVRLVPAQAPFVVVSTATTAPADTATALRRTRVFYADTVLLEGRIPRGRTPARLAVAVTDPTRYFEAALTQVLREGGVAVLEGGEDRRHPTVTGLALAVALPPDTATLFTWRSITLAELMPFFEKPSQNQIGEALMRTVGGVVTGTASQDSGRAAVRATLAGWGVPEDAVVYVDGSGLSRYNYVAPDAIATVLWTMAHRSDSALFREALPVAGVDGTLEARLRGTAAERNVRAKTGSIANVRTLSGYVTTVDGERLLFVLMANHFTAPRRVIERTQDHVVERLANFSRRR